jgi:hypothetical protein
VSASLVLGIVGTLIALGGLFYTWRERRDRQDAVEQERSDRLEDVELVRRQVEAIERQTELVEAASDAAQAADVRVKNGGRDGLGWSFNLVNVGRGAATSVKAWMVDAATGNDVSVSADLPGPLLPNAETERRLKIPLTEEFIKKPPPLAVMLSWTDTRGRERRDEHPIDL